MRGSLPKKKVVGASIGDAHKAYPLKLLRERQGPLEDQIDNTKVTIQYDPTADSAQVLEADSGRLLPSVIAYWFAWATFHPDALVYSATSQEGQ